MVSVPSLPVNNKHERNIATFNAEGISNPIQKDRALSSELDSYDAWRPINNAMYYIFYEEVPTIPELVCTIYTNFE